MGVIRNTYEQQQQIIKDNDAFRASYNGTQNQSQYVDYTAPDPNAGQQQQQVQQVEAPRYWTPQQINLQYLQDQNTPETPDEIRPGGASREGIAQANSYYSIINNNAPITDWKTQEQDPYYDSIIKPNWGDPTVVQPATVEDPLGAILPATPDYGKGNWEDMNWLGKTYSALSSSNTAEGAPAWKNLTAAIIPSVTSAGGGAALGAAVAAGLTMAGLAVPVMPAAVIGGTATAAAMFVQSAFGVKIPVINQVLEAIDIAATKSEQVWGTAEQYIYRGEVENAGEFILELAKLGLGMDSKLGDRDNFDAKMAAASARYETKTTGLGDTAIDAINSLYNVFAEEDMAISKPGEAYLYNRGLMDPQQVQTPEGPEALDMLAGVASELVKTVNPETEKEYTYREASDLVQQWAMDTFGTTAQFNELIESSIYDPANLVPFISSYAVKKYGDITGDAAYSTAGNLTMGNPFIDALPPVFQQAAEAVAHKFGKRGGSQGFFSVLDTYQNVLRYGTKLDTMTAGQMANAKLTADGKFAELQPTNRTGRFGWLQSLFDQTPESKALGLTALSNDLITAVASTSPDIESFKANLLALVNDTAPDSNSPIAGIWGTAAWKTSLDDLKTIVKKGDYNVLFEQFGLTDGNRAALVDISNGLGKKQKDVVTLTEENPDLLKTMIADYAAQHEGKIGNVIVDDGGENAVAMLKLYTGKTPVAWNDQILRYEVAAKISDGLSDILIQRYGIKEDHAIFRLSNLMKKAQSVLLLGFSPSYLANNLMNNIVTRASVGAIGAVTLNQYTTFLEKSGMFPARFAEDAGLLRGDYSDASTPYGKATQNISDAKRKGDLIDTAGDAIGKTNKFSLGKLNRKIESSESQRAFGAGIMQYFHREWKPGKDFRKMDKALETAIEMQSPGLSKFIYSTIGQNYNMADIEKALYSAILTPDASEVLTNIGKRLFPNDPYVVSEIFDKAGITNELQERMKNAKTRAEREQVVKDIINNSEKYRDRMAANEIANMAEAAGNITTAEGLPGAHEMLINQALYEQEHWGSHISAMSRAYDIKEKYGLSNEAWTNTISSVMARVQQDWKHSNEISLQLDKGIIDGLGMSDMIGREYSKAMIDQHAARRNYYAQKSEHVNEVYRITKDIYSNKKLSDEQKAIQVRTAWDNFYDRTEADYIEYFNKYEMPMMIKRQDLFMKAYEEATGADTSKLKATFDSLITIRGEMFDAEVEVHKKTREIRQSSMDRAAKDQACNQVEAEHNVFKNGKINEMRELNVKIANESAKDGFVARAENGVKAPEAPAAVTTADQIKSAIELQHFAKEADVGKTDAQVKNQGYLDRDAIRNEYIDNNFSESDADLLMGIYDERAKQWESENPGKNFYTEKLRLREMSKSADAKTDPFLSQVDTIKAADINTDAFRKFFDGSKVVNEDGSPKVVYHGSPNQFEAFNYDRMGTTGTVEGYGFYFTDSMEMAESYTKSDGSGSIYESYVDIKKPISNDTKEMTRSDIKKLLKAIDKQDMVSDDPYHWTLSMFGDTEREGVSNVLQKATESLFKNNDLDIVTEIINLTGRDAEPIYRVLKDTLGYDGIITKWAANADRGEVNIYIPFLPEQIKSIYNQGTWDSDNANMLYQDRVKGAFEVIDGDSFVRFMEAKDLSTAVHETGHLFRRTLSDSQMSDFTQWAGFDSAETFQSLEYRYWNDPKSLTDAEKKSYIDAEEKFARGFEQYLIEGSAPTIGLKVVFKKFANYLLNIYKSVKDFFTKDYSRQGEFVFDGQVLDIKAEVNGIKLRDIFDSMLTDDVQRTDSYDSIVSKRLESLSNDAVYRTWDKERLYNRAKKEVNGEILNRFGDFHNAEYVAATMERPFDLGNDMIVDDVTLYEAIADAKANTGQNPFIGEDGIYGDSISTPEQSRYSFEQKEFATPDDALFYYDQQQDSYDRGTAVPLEDAGNLDLTGWDPNRINELRQNLYDLMLEGMDPQYHEYGRAYADSVIGNKDAMNEIVSRNAAVPEDIRGEFYHRYMINEKLISDINRERDIAANMSVNRIPMEGGFFLKRMPEQQFGEFTIVGNVYRDGQLVAYYPYNLTTDAIQTSDGRNIKVLGVDPMNADQYVYYDALANEVDTVNTRTPRGFENAYEQSEGETLVNRGTPLGATPMIEVDGSANNEILNDYIYPILDEFPAEYEKAYAEGIDKNLKNVDQDTRVRVMKYLDDVVQPDMASSKFNAMKFGEFKRDAALLNYSKTYGFDSYLTMISPYQFWYTRSMMNWAKRLVDKPAYLTMAMRMKNLAERNKQEEYPYRLNDLFRIPFAGLPDWMGGGIFVDILPQIFPFLQFGSPVEDLLSEQNTINKKAYSVLDEMIEANQITEAQKTEAIRTKNNDIWNTALAQAKLEYGSDPSINSLFEQYLSPPLLLSWAKKIYEGKENEIGMLPITRFGNTIGTLTDDTFLEGLGQVTKSAMTAPEKAMRKIAGLDYKEFGEYQDYNIKKQISQMVLEGLPVQDGLNAMVEMSGDIYDEAVKRQREENALKTQGALPIYEMKRLLQGEEGASMSGVLAALAFAPLGVKIFPTGEQAAREAQTGLNQAYIDKDNGDSNAVSRFWDENKEYYARLASFKDSPEELMRYVLHSYSKNFYYDQPKAQQQAILNNYGPEFYKAVIDPTTSNYRNVDIDKLAFWAQGLTGNIPNIPQLEAVRNQKQTLQLYAPQVVSDYDLYIQERDRLFPGQSAKNTPFYSLDKTQKAAYEKTDPVYAQYRQWEYEYKKAHPNVQTVKDDQSNYYDEKMAYESFGDMDDSVVEDFDHWAVTGLPMRGTTTRVLNNLYKKYANPNFDNYDQYLDILKRYRQ